MIRTIRVKTAIGPDLKGHSVLNEIRTVLSKNSVEKVETATVYRLEGITKKEAKVLAEKLFCESINQIYSLNKPILINNYYSSSDPPLSGKSREGSKHIHVIEIAYKPGVMNPEVGSILKAAKDLGISLLAADSSREYGFYGNISKEELTALVEKLNLYNKTVEYIVENEPQTLLIKGAIGKTATIPLQEMTDNELLVLSKDKLFLNLEEMKVIQNYFAKIKRDPTDCELETLAQTWSEHCAHKTFKAKLIVDGVNKDPLISRIKKEALKHNRHIVSAFVDNSGVMDFYEDYAVCGKVETHNAPSAIEPYGGAMTGSGGVFRDVVGTGQGAKTIASTDIFCFATPDFDKSKLPKGTLPPDYLLKRVVAGVRDYGNRMGIPTNNGSVHFHYDFRAKPTVIVGAYGILPKKRAKKGKPKVGDLVVVVGGRTGRDGIHGATFSSGEMTDQTLSVHSSAVQIGNAIEEKRMFDGLLEARDENCIRAIQDCGAGGFSSAIGEMGEKIGVTVHLEKAPLKYQGLSHWEIWVSESQERMICAIPKTKIKPFGKICKKYNVEYAVLGRFDGSKKLKVKYRNELVCNLDMKFLHHGLLQRIMIAKKGIKNYESRIKKNPNVPKTEKEWISVLKKVLSHGNVCSKEPIVRMYDHSVQATNDLQPYSGKKLDGPNDAVVLRPFLDKRYGVVISHGLNPILNSIDPYRGSIWAAVEALSNYVAVGGNYKDASLINNYIWPFPDEESLWSLDKSVDAVVDIMKAFKIPVISGKDSLSSTYRTSPKAGRGKDGTVIKIPPVLCISVFGKIENASKTITSDLKKTGSVLCLVGVMDVDSMGGSVYYQIQGIEHGAIPTLDLKIIPQVFFALYKGIQNKKIFSAHDISEGGLITTLFEMCVGGDMGTQVNATSGVSIRPDYFLFNETAGCFVVEIDNEETAKKLFHSIPYLIIGHTQKNKQIVVQGKKASLKEVIFKADLEELKKAWNEPMETLFP